MAVRALVVDDQPVIRDILRLRLERLGCVVAEAEHARQGLEVFNSFMPQVVTLDIIMPVVAEYTALDLLRDIRKAAFSTDVVIISSKANQRGFKVSFELEPLHLQPVQIHLGDVASFQARATYPQCAVPVFQVFPGVLQHRFGLERLHERTAQGVYKSARLIFVTDRAEH